MACLSRNQNLTADLSLLFLIFPPCGWIEHDWWVFPKKKKKKKILLVCSNILLNRETGTLVSIIQNDFVSFSFLQITYLGIVQAACSIASTIGFWYFQRYFKISTKAMFLVTNLFSVLIPFWGMLGIWVRRIGYHSKVGCMALLSLASYLNWPGLDSGNSTFTMWYLGCFKLHTMRYESRSKV